MYRSVVIALGLLLAQTSPSQENVPSAPGSLGLKDVIDMLQAKVAEDIVFEMIDHANLHQSLSAQEIVALTKAGATRRIIHELDSSISLVVTPTQPAVSQATTPNSSSAAAAKAEDDSNDPDLPHKPGLYLWSQDANGDTRMEVIEKSVPQSSRQKMSGLLGWAVYAFLPRPRADVRTKYTKPVFYFYVGETARINGEVDSPGQLALIQMEAQTMQGLAGRRLLYAKEPHLFAHPIIGTDPKAIRLFKATRMSSQIFRLSPDGDLVPGEYCFFFNNEGSFDRKGTAAAITLWDFGID